MKYQYSYELKNGAQSDWHDVEDDDNWLTQMLDAYFSKHSHAESTIDIAGNRYRRVIDKAYIRTWSSGDEVSVEEFDETSHMYKDGSIREATEFLNSLWDKDAHVEFRVNQFTWRIEHNRSNT